MPGDAATADAVEQLRSELARSSGAARTRPLHDLARILAERYWRGGPGKPEGRPLLDEAIAALEEVYGYLEPDDGVRAPVAVQLGWLLAIRHTGHGSGPADREVAIVRLSESVDHPRLAPAMAAGARVILGQLHLSRATGGVVAMTRTVVRGLAEGTDAEAAAECFRRALSEPGLDVGLVEMVQTLLAMAEAAAAADVGAMSRAGQRLQRLQREGVPGVQWPADGPLFNRATVADLDPLDRPILVVDGPEPVPRPRPARPEPAAAAPEPDADALRAAFRERLGAGDDPVAAIGWILAAGAPARDVDTVDELVALATMIVASPAPTAADQLLLALALHLRGSDDADAALDSLCIAAADPAAPMPATLRLGLALSDRDTGGRLARALAPLTSALRAIGADALAYPQADGLLLLHAATGRAALASGRTLPRRVLVVGEQPVAAGTSILSTLSGHRQLLELAARRRRPVTERPALLAAGTEATAAARQLRHLFYPRAADLATAADLLAHLDASMLDIGCRIGSGGALLLAGSTELTPGEIAAHHGSAGGLVVLPPAGDHFAVLADAFLSAGSTGVVGWSRPIPSRVATAVRLELHSRLTLARQDPAAAVHAVRRWLRNPERTPPPDYAADLAAADPRAVNDALAYRGI